MKRFSVLPVCYVSYPVLALLCGTQTFLRFLAAIAVHEFGHILAIALFKLPVMRITVLPFGLDIKRGEGCSYIAEAVISIGGPVIGILFACVAYALGYVDFFAVNLFCSLINLLPVRTLDGGGALRAVLMSCLPFERAVSICSVISGLTLFAVYISSVILFLYTEWNVTLLAFCAVLFMSVFYTSKQ